MHSKDMGTGEMPFGNNGFFERSDMVMRRVSNTHKVGENVAMHDGTDIEEAIIEAVNGWLSDKQDRI